jgi:hypothetical protein
MLHQKKNELLHSFVSYTHRLTDFAAQDKEHVVILVLSPNGAQKVSRLIFLAHGKEKRL